MMVLTFQTSKCVVWFHQRNQWHLYYSQDSIPLKIIRKKNWKIFGIILNYENVESNEETLNDVCMRSCYVDTCGFRVEMKLQANTPPTPAQGSARPSHYPWTWWTARNAGWVLPSTNACSQTTSRFSLCCLLGIVEVFSLQCTGSGIVIVTNYRGCSRFLLSHKTDDILARPHH